MRPHGPLSATIVFATILRIPLIHMPQGILSSSLRGSSFNRSLTETRVSSRCQCHLFHLKDLLSYRSDRTDPGKQPPQQPQLQVLNLSWKHEILARWNAMPAIF